MSQRSGDDRVSMNRVQRRRFECLVPVIPRGTVRDRDASGARCGKVVHKRHSNHKRHDTHSDVGYRDVTLFQLIFLY